VDGSSEDPVLIPRPGRLRLHPDRFPGEPVLDTAVSHALLRRVAAGAQPESLRLYTPENVLLFSSLDARRPGFPRAVELARTMGFEAVIRLAGGHAAAFLSESLAFAWARPDPDAHLHIRARFEHLAEWIRASLRRLGLDARIGPLPGEYCPGEFSVNLAGRVKVMGVGQRVIRGGAHVGGVLTLAQTEALRAVLIPIYEALEIEFRPETAGGVRDLEPDLDAGTVLEAMGEVLRQQGYELEPHHFDDAMRSDAERLCPLHLPERSGTPGALLRPDASLRSSKVFFHSDRGDSSTGESGPPD
jgi:lipoate-protein ligase A